MEEYEKLLKRLYKELPEKAKTKARWKEPSFESFIEGKKTVITNFNEVVTALRRDKVQLIKYLTKELAAPGEVEGNRLVLKGKFRDAQLNNKLKSYINTYVLCSECGKPDTELITQNKVLFLRCEACGAKHPVKGG